MARKIAAGPSRALEPCTAIGAGLWWDWSPGPVKVTAEAWGDLNCFLQGEGDRHEADWPKGHQPTPNVPALHLRQRPFRRRRLGFRERRKAAVPVGAR